MREAMRTLAQGIVASYDARATGLVSIRRDVAAQLQELDEAHNAMARQQRADLSKGHADLKASVSAQVRELDQAHNAMAQRQRQGLAKVRAGLNRAENRRKSGVHSWMEEVASTHQAMAQELRADLSKGHANLKASVSAQVQELDRAHQAMARQQRETLAKVHSELALAERQRKSDVKTWMEEVAAAHAAGREEWQNLARTMQAKRAGVVVAEAPPEVAPAAAVEEEAVEVGEVTEEFAAISARVFTYLANHPDGTRLSELEREFGLGRFQAARVVRHLRNEGKAKKQGLRYFAT